MPRGVYSRKACSEETKIKISMSLKNRVMPIEQREKIKASQKKKPIGCFKAGIENLKQGREVLKEKFKTGDLITRSKISIAAKKRYEDKDERLKLSLLFRGKNGNNWQGGITLLNKSIRQSLEMKLWREVVYQRDNWTCQECYEKSGKLNAHHLKNFSQHPELRFAIDNGITLCETYHAIKHSKNTGGHYV